MSKETSQLNADKAANLSDTTFRKKIHHEYITQMVDAWMQDPVVRRFVAKRKSLRIALTETFQKGTLGA
jgi:hypothetical protein